MEGLGELEFVSRPKKKPNKKMATMPKAKYFFISSYLSVAFVAYCYQRLKVLFLLVFLVRAPKQHKAQRRKQKKDFGEFSHLESGPMRNSIYSTIIPYFFFNFKRASFEIL